MIPLLPLSAMTLSAGDLMAYIDCGNPSEELIQLVKLELQTRELAGMLELVEEYSISTLICRRLSLRVI